MFALYGMSYILLRDMCAM